MSYFWKHGVNLSADGQAGNLQPVGIPSGKPASQYYGLIGKKNFPVWACRNLPIDLNSH